MSRIIKIGSLFLVLAIFLPSCTKLPQGLPDKEGSLPKETLAQNQSIPSQWGKLVSVAISPDFPRMTQLWFQNEEGDIHLAFYDLRQNRLFTEAVVIRR